MGRNNTQTRTEICALTKSNSLMMGINILSPRKKKKQARLPRRGRIIDQVKTERIIPISEIYIFRGKPDIERTRFNYLREPQKRSKWWIAWSVIWEVYSMQQCTWRCQVCDGSDNLHAFWTPLGFRMMSLSQIDLAGSGREIEILSQIIHSPKIKYPLLNKVLFLPAWFFAIR